MSKLDDYRVTFAPFHDGLRTLTGPFSASPHAQSIVIEDSFFTGGIIDSPQLRAKWVLQDIDRLWVRNVAADRDVSSS